MKTAWLLFKTLLLLFVKIVCVLLGFIIVAVALPFRKESKIKYPMTQYAGEWWHVGLPEWAWIWSNDRDGLLGDRRGWWKTHTPLGQHYTSFFSMYWWAAIRNPANNLRYTSLMGCNVEDCDYVLHGDKIVEDDVGLGGKQLVIATDRNTGKQYAGLYVVYEYPFWKKHALIIQLGFKIKPSSFEDIELGHPANIKGFTWEINPFKNIE